MAQVFKTDMIAHLWANQSQESARNSTKNFWFNNGALYSYGSHYIVGLITDWMHEGKKVILLNSEKYGVTTSKHCDLAWRAINQRTSIYFHLNGISHNDFNSYNKPLWRFVAEKAIRESFEFLSDACGFRAEHKIQTAFNRALDAAKLARIATDNAPKTEKAEARKVARKIPEFEGLKPSRSGLAVMREKLEKERHKNKALKYAQECINHFCSAYGFADSEGVKLSRNDFTPTSEGRYCRDAFTANDLAVKSKDALRMAKSNAKAYALSNNKKGVKLPKMPSEKAIEELLKALAPVKAKAAFDSAMINVDRALRFYASEKSGDKKRKENKTLSLFHHRASDVNDDYLVLELATMQEKRKIEFFKTLAKRSFNAVKWASVENTIQRAFANKISAASYLPKYPEDAKRMILNAQNYVNLARQQLELLGEKGAKYYASRIPDFSDVEQQLTELENQIKARNAERLDAWRKGEGSASSVRALSLSPMLRVKGEKIETSWGAEIPKMHAAKVWRLIQIVKAKNEAWTCPPNESISLGYFKLIEVRIDGSIVVGCHDIPASEIERMAIELGFVQSEENADA